MNIPLQRDRGGQSNLRSAEKSKAAEFPASIERKKQ